MCVEGVKEHAGVIPLKQHKKDTTPAAAATQMTDSEMDKVTAGGMIVDTFRNGLVDTNSSATGAFHAGINGFQGNNPHAASCLNCGL